MKSLYLLVFLIGVGFSAKSQETNNIFSLEEFLAMVKQHHPVVAQANLLISTAESELLKARGALDPKLSGGLSQKEFYNTSYYSLWKGSFKVPTWYGVDLKAGYEQNDGYYLNPQNTTPENGLWSAGISLKLAKGFLYNDRMNAIKQAKILRQKNELERDILINTIIAEAVKAYAEWNYYYENKQVYKEFLDNAEIRYNGVLRSSELGETRALDTLETKITVRNRSLELKQANLSLQKAKLYVSNFLWIEETPVEMQENLVPMVSENSIIENLGLPNFLGNTENLEEHPKLKSMQFELDGYDLDIKLKRNNLLPNINLEYNFLDKEYDELRNFTTSNYKAGVNVSFPLFLRKERGDLKLAKIKRENTELKLDQTKLKLSNKIKFTEQELLSLEEQLLEIRQIVEESEIMVTSEKRLFEIGESSIFLVNSRENKLIEAELKRNKIENEYYKAAAKLFENLRLNL